MDTTKVLVEIVVRSPQSAGWPNVIAAIASAVAAIVACVAVFLAWKQLTQASKYARGQLMAELLQHFYSERVHVAMSNIAEWMKENPQNFKERYKALFEECGVDNPVNLDRRMAKSYCSQIYKLHQVKCLGEKEARVLAGETQASLLLKVIQPIEKEHYEITVKQGMGGRPFPDEDKKMYEFFEGLFPDARGDESVDTCDEQGQDGGEGMNKAEK